MNYEIHIKQNPSQFVATRRLSHASLDDLGRAMHSTLAKIAMAVSPADAARGAPFAVYYNEPFRPDDIDVEMGLPIEPRAEIRAEDNAEGEETVAGEIHRRTLTGGPVAYTVHLGPYSQLGPAYEALYTWIKVHGYERIGPPREVYLIGPAQTSVPSEYRTRIEAPIASRSFEGNKNKANGNNAGRPL